MKKYYRMIIENIKTGERKSYISPTQGACPPGWKVIAIAGYFEK